MEFKKITFFIIFKGMKNSDFKVVLVTGGTSGIGKATAKLLSQKGFIVYAVGRDTSKAQDLKNFGVHLEFMDMEDEESMKRVVSKIVNESGRIDVLVNNAGYGIAGAVEDIPIEEARKQFEVNLFSQIKLSQLVIPIMRENKKGKIINITSIASLVPSPILSWYSASKVAFSFLSFALREEVGQFGIDVVEIAPGGINTNWPIIATQYLQKFSEGSLYSSMINKIFDFFAKSIKSSPSPDIVAKKILKVIDKKKTKPRYFVPFYGNFVSILLRITPLSLIDKLFKFYLS